MLPGYGVEVVLKNMEYSAMDDKAKADAAAAAKKAAKKAQKGSSDASATAELADIDLSSLGEVKGFKFDVLAQRKPHLVQELMTFRDVLMSNDEEEAIKVKLGAVAMRVMHLWQAFPISMLLIRKQSCSLISLFICSGYQSAFYTLYWFALPVKCVILAHDPWYHPCAVLCTGVGPKGCWPAGCQQGGCRLRPPGPAGRDQPELLEPCVKLDTAEGRPGCGASISKFSGG